MNASKEIAARVLKYLDYLQGKIKRSELMGDSQVLFVIDQIREFLEAAKRKLPTEQAYENDRKRRGNRTR